MQERELELAGGQRRLDRMTRILEQARRTFLEHGLRQTTMDQIARAAGLRKSSLYYYFASKEDLFVALVRQDGEQRIAELQAALAAAASPEERVLAFASGLRKDLNQHENMRQRMLDEDVEYLPRLLHELRDLLRREEELLLEVVRAGVREGRFVEEGAETFCHGLLAALRGAGLYLFFSGGDIAHDRRAIEGLNLVVEAAVRSLVISSEPTGPNR